MANPRILEYFFSNNRLYEEWFGNANDSDCKPWSDLSYNDIRKYQEGFDIGKTLILLFVRDTSSWNDGRKGLVITDDFIIIKKSTKDTFDIDDDDWDLISFEDIDSVKYNYGLFSFYNSAGEVLLNVPTEYLFKGYVNDSVKNELVHHLTEMAKLATNKTPFVYKCPVCGSAIGPFKSIYQKYLGQTNTPDADKKICLANDLLVGYIWFLSHYFELFPSTDDPKDYLAGSKMMSQAGSHAKCWYFWTDCSDELIECCDHHDWNLFDEYDSILSTNDEIFIRKSLTVLNADIYMEGVGISCYEMHRVFKTGELVEPMKALISLVKARCYFKLCKQSENKTDEQTKHYQLATEHLAEYEKSPYRAINLLKKYEDELRSEMSNYTPSNNTFNGVFSPMEFSEPELKYLEAFHTALIEGSVSDSDRRLLERLRDSLGISQMEAGELEAILSSRLNDEKKPQLNENEEEYLSAIKDSLADGEITERRRRMLDTYRDSLGISQERAKEIESMA